MQNRPDAPELAEAIAEFMRDEVLPTLDDDRLRFRTRVAINGLEMLVRELRGYASASASAVDEQRSLARRIRHGDASMTIFAKVKQLTEDKLRVASPRYLKRCGVSI